jgi:hypothetical protein
MNPIVLTEQGTDDVLAYACRKCRMVVSSPESHGDGAAEYAAAHCEPPACECGLPVPKGRINCDACAAAERWMRDAARFVKAKRIDARSYGGPVFDPEEQTGNGGYHASLDDLLAELEDVDDDARPFFVHPCDEKRPQLDADDVIDRLQEDYHEGAVFEGVDLLQQILDAWCESQSVVTWVPDESRVIVINEEEAAEYAAEYERRRAAQAERGT